MNSQLDVLKDLAQKKALLEPTRVDLELHRGLADACGSRQSWMERFERVTQGPHALSESEFHYYQLYRPEVTEAEIGSYIGKAMQMELHDRCNSPLWIATSGDKALFELILKGAGLPVSNTLAILARSPRSGFARQLKSKHDLREFLVGQSQPVFCKPIDGMFGIGAFLIEAVEGDMVRLVERPPESLDDFYTYLSQFSLSGYMFQEVIAQSPFMAERFGAGVATVRFLVFNSGDPKVVSAVLRIPKADAIADNFWQSGNLLAGIDIETGQISRAIQNCGDRFQEISQVPATGGEMRGCKLQAWRDAVQLVLSAATLFPEVGTQSWDIAFSQAGPLAVEYNWGGDLNLHQLANRRGLYDASYRAHVSRFNNTRLNL